MKKSLHPYSLVLSPNLLTYFTIVLILIAFLLPKSIVAQQGATTYTINANNSGASFNLNNNESLLIPAGITFTGNINWNGANSKVFNNGTWRGNDANLQTGCGIYTASGSTTQLSNINMANGVTISNLGYLKAGVNWNGDKGTITNKGTWECSGNIPVGQNGTLTNEQGGKITCTDLNLNSTNSSALNRGELRLANCNVSNGTTLRNYATCVVADHTNISGSLFNEGNWQTKYYNNNNFTNNCGTIEVSVTYHNNGSSKLVNTGMLKAYELINDSEVQGQTVGKGVGKVIVASKASDSNPQLCRQNGSGKFGVVGRLDLSRCQPGNFNMLRSDYAGKQGWDIQTGELGTGYTYNTASQTGGCTAQVLPVELVSFTAQVRSAAIVLNWQTASEKNNDKFVVERSVDGRVFQPIVTVKGAGSTSAAINYTTTDSQPLPGTSYYRLQQLDLDGSTHYSPVLSVANANTNATALGLAAYPNPVANRLTLDLQGLPEAAGTALLRNLSGQLVATLPLSATRLQELDVHSLPAGTYFLQVAGTKLVQRIVKL